MEKIDSETFKVSALQATIYTPDLDHSASKMMSSFYPKYADFFDADPEVLPSVPGLPAEVPRIILRKKDNTMRLEIAASRLNFFERLSLNENSNIDDKIFFEVVVKLLSDFQEITESRVGRLAAVRTLFIPNDNPGFFLARHFCKDKWSEAPLDRPENFEIHSHKVYNLADKFNINSWARSKTGFLTSPDKKIRVIIFEQDLNTIDEEKKEKAYQVGDIQSFYKEVIPEFDKILSLYYPINHGG